MDWLINPPHSPPSHPQSTAVRWFLVFRRMIMNLSPSHKGTGQPIMEACSYCGSHAMRGNVAPAVAASCLSKESRCGDLLICTVTLLTHWDVFDDILPSHVSFPLLLTYILPLPTSSFLTLFPSLSLAHAFSDFISSPFSPLSFHVSFFCLPLIHPLSHLLSLSLHATCHAKKASWYFIKHNMRRRMKFMRLICFNHDLCWDWESFEM